MPFRERRQVKQSVCNRKDNLKGNSWGIWKFNHNKLKFPDTSTIEKDINGNQFECNPRIRYSTHQWSKIPKDIKTRIASQKRAYQDSKKKRKISQVNAQEQDHLRTL